MRPRFSLRQLLAFVVFVAIACGTLATPSLWLASVVFSAILAGFAVAILTAVGRMGRARYFWVGFALSGWGYLWLAHEPVVVQQYTSWAFQSNGPLVTAKLLEAMFSARYPRPQPAGNGRGMFSLTPEVDLMARQGDNGGGVPLAPSVWLSPGDYADFELAFYQVGHALFAIVFAYLGGCLTQTLYDRRSEKPAVV